MAKIKENKHQQAYIPYLSAVREVELTNKILEENSPLPTINTSWVSE